MSRGLGATLALSFLAHGGAVAAVGALGIAWLGGSPPARVPAPLFVDLVQPLVAVNAGIAPADAGAPRIRPERGAPAASPGLAVATPRTHFHVPAPPVPGAPGASGPELRPLDGPAPTQDEVVRPPVAPVAPEPRSALAEAPTATAAGAAAESIAESSPPTRTSGPPLPTAVENRRRDDTAGVAVRALPPSSVPPASPGEVASTRLSPARHLPSPDGHPETSAAAHAGRDADRAAAVPSGVPGGGGTATGARSPEQGDVARLAPGETPSPGHHHGGIGGGAIPPEYEPYLRALRQRVQDRLVYPWMAVRRGQQGIVELEVRLGPEGRLVGVEVVAGPTAETLRTAAVAAVRSAAPFTFPPGLEGRPLVIRLPVEFRLR